MTQNLETKLNQEFFKQDPETVAKQLLGRDLVRIFGTEREVRGRILEVSAWQGTYGEHTKHKFDDYEPGTVSVSCKYGKHLIDITCGNGTSCVTLINGEYEFGGEKVKVNGPGNFSKALQVDKSFDGIDITVGPYLRVEGTAVDESLVKKRNKKKVPPNCVGFFYIK